MNWNTKDLTAKTILELAPFLAPFKERYKLFQDSIKFSKNAINSGYIEPSQMIKIRRDRIFLDAFELLNSDEKIRRLRKVNFVNMFGLQEVGVDAGGLFKEFFVELSKQVFNAKFGLFLSTAQNELYPNPEPTLAQFRDQKINILQCYEFIGKILSKAVYEKIVIEPQFADFFLRKMLGKPIDYKDLKSFDLDLYKQLIEIKNMDNIENIGIFFITNSQKNNVFF